MLIDCVLKCWYKKSGEKDDRYYEIPTYSAHHYEGKEYELKYELQIISLQRESRNEIEILKKQIIVPQEKTTYYISFHTVCYGYNHEYRTIHCTNTQQEI